MGIFGKKDSSNSQLNQLSGALKNKDALSEILIQSIGDGIIATDTNGKIILINTAAGALTEWSTEEALNIDSRLVVKLIKDEKTGELVSDAEHPFTNVIQTRIAFSETMLLVSRNKHRTYVSLAISPVLLPKNDELVGIVAVIKCP